MSRQDSIWFWQQHPEKSLKKYVRMTQKQDNKLALLHLNRKNSFFDKKCQNIFLTALWQQIAKLNHF